MEQDKNMAEKVSAPAWDNFTAAEEANHQNGIQDSSGGECLKEEELTVCEEESESQTESADFGADKESSAPSEEAHEAVAELAKAWQERDEYLNHLQRLQAEFDNYRKRTQKERLDLKEYLLEEFMRKLLEVVDNMERALHPDNRTEDMESYRSGVEMVFKKMMVILEDYGLTRIESVGKPFDPRFHEAVMNVETDKHEPGTVVMELTPGYCLKDRVLQAPKVQVAIRPSGPQNEPGESGSTNE
jgi:molecular chaperone GrpE